MKIASQLISAAPSNSVTTSSAGDSSDSGAGFQSVFAAANGTASKSTTPQVPVAKEPSTPASPRTAETKKKDASTDKGATAIDPAAILANPAPVLQPSPVLPVNERSAGQDVSQEAQGASLTGQFTASTGIDSSLASLAPLTSVAPITPLASLTPLAEGVATETAGKTAPIVKLTETAAVKAEQPAAAAATQSNSPLHVPISTASADTDAAKGKGPQPESASDPDQGPGSAASAKVVDPAAAAVQNIATSMQFPAMAPLNQLQETAMAAASKGVEGSSLAGLAKGKTASSELRDKKTDDASSSDQADGSAATATPFAAKISDAMAGLPRTTETAHVALDTSALQQSPQIAQGDAAGHLAGQGLVGQDGKASTGAATDASAPAAQFPAPGDAMPGVSSAHLVQSVNSSEMRLGMQSAEFGNISISTSLNHQALSAQISIDHSELGRALAVHLPAIEEKLGTAYGVQAKVELRDSNTPSQSGDSGYSNAGQQSKDQRQSQGGAAQGSTASVFAPETNYTRTNAFTSSTASSAASLSRLDIRV